MSAVVAARAWRLDASLRDVPVDPAGFLREVDARIDAIATARSQPAQLLAMLVETAPLLVIAGRMEEARKTASAAVALAELLEDARQVFAAQLVLARVMHREGRHEIATPLFDQLISSARSMPMHAASLHEVLFEAGRNLFDQGQHGPAARLFRESLALRRAGGREDLLEDCAEALRRCAQARS